MFLNYRKWPYFQDEMVEMEGKDPRDQEDLRERKVSVVSLRETFLDLCDSAIITFSMHAQTSESKQFGSSILKKGSFLTTLLLISNLSY